MISNNDYDYDPINLFEFTENICTTKIPTYPYGSITIDKVLSEEEITQIKTLLKLNFLEVIKTYKKHPHVIVD